MSNVKRCFDLLNENDDKVYKEVCDVLSRLCRNVMKHPNEVKYRTVRLSNQTVIDKILPAVGAMECLFEIGFLEKDDHLFLPQNSSLSNLRELERLLSIPRTGKPEPKIPQAETAGNSLRNLNREIVWEAEEKFFGQIRMHFQDVLKYENVELQERAKGVVPIAQLEINAMEKMRSIQKDVKMNGDDKSVENLTMEDLVFAELLKWFKESFFQWVDSPNCTNCPGNCSLDKVIACNKPGVSRIEIHRCSTCATIVEFPRYTDPGILLYTRKGRCGEWANAFALICRSLGYDTRHVWDYTDHVWVEIWSMGEKRWVHGDPCENAMDRPLIYEKGWGKKLSYVLAFSKDEVQDVTWRYTSKQSEVIKRRKLCTEEKLLSFTMSLTADRRRNSCSIPRQEYLTRRTLMELVELINCHFGGIKNDEEGQEYQGRTSGSLAWRLARQETKIASQSSYTWLIPANVDSAKLIYTASRDEYIFLDNNGERKIFEKKNGWAKGVYQMSGGIYRKVENDWKMVYLARSEGNDRGNIEWMFEIVDTKREIDEFSFRSTTAVFNGATIEWKVEGYYRNGEKKLLSVVNESNYFKTDKLKGAFKINLSAVLSGGKNELAWQHAQLFRQSLNDDEHSMEIIIYLNKITT